MTQMRKLHRVLVTRILVVTAVVSVAVGVLVVRNERSRVIAVAADRALIRAGTLRTLLLDRLDAGRLGEGAEIENALGAVAYKGFHLHTGHYVLLRVLDRDGAEVARVVDSTPIVGGHHEKYDGSGYYAQLRGSDIPLEARIFAVADVFDAVTSHRPYHKPLDFDDAMGLLEAGRAKHFDPEILDAFATIARTLYDTYADRDDEELRRDHAAIVERYYRGDLTELMS